MERDERGRGLGVRQSVGRPPSPFLSDDASVAANDVGMSFLRIPDLNKAYDAVGAAYVSAVKRLHAAGLRAFVFSLVLPVHRADMGRGKPYEESLKHAARLFNAVVVRGAVQRWCAAAKDVLCVVLDTCASPSEPG